MPLVAEEVYDEALGYCVLGMYEEAMTSFEQISPESLGSKRALDLSIAMSRASENWEELVDIASVAVEFYPTEAYYWALLIRSCVKAMDFSFVDDVFARSLHYVPKNGLIHFEYAVYLTRTERWIAARPYSGRLQFSA